MKLSGFLRYASVQGIDVVSQAFLLTIGWSNFVRCVEFMYWDGAVLDYGILCSVLNTGRLLTMSTMRAMLMIDQGNNVVKSDSSLTTETRQVTSLGVMAVSFLLLSLTNRYSWLVLCYFAIGCAGSQLVGLTSHYSHLGDDFDMHSTLSKTLFFTGGGGGVLDGMRSGNTLSKWDGEQEKPTDSELNKRAIICFLCASLISAIMFSDDVTDLKPSFSAFGSVGLLCIVLASLRVMDNENICHRRHSTFGRFVTGCVGFLKMTCGSLWRLGLSYIDSASMPHSGAEEDRDFEAAESLLSSKDDHHTSNSGGSGGKAAVNAFTHLTGGESADLSPFTGALPPAFLAMCKGDEAKARVAYARTLLWRQQNRVDEVLSLPQPTFYQIIESFPHAIHGRSREGCVVVYEKLGQSKPLALRDQAISPENLVEHFIMRNEFVQQRLAAPSDGESESEGASGSGSSKGPVRLMSVLDVAGISVGDITTDVLAFLRISGQVVDSHYPGMVARLVICNAPSWFWTVWSMIARVLPESTRDSIVIIGDAQGLDQYVDPSQRPAEYGGTDVPLGQAPEFLEFCEIAREWERAGYEMFTTLAEKQQARTRKPSVPKSDEKRRSGVSGSVAAARRNGDWDSDSDSSDSAEWELVDEDEEDDYEEAGQGGSSIYEWVRSRFRKPDQAYLGDKNCFRYDEEAGQWRMAPSSSTPQRASADKGSSSRARAASNMSAPGGAAYRSPAYGASTREEAEQRVKETLEEHGLVLAIQAAHMANLGGAAAAAAATATVAGGGEGEHKPLPLPLPIDLDATGYSDGHTAGSTSSTPHEVDGVQSRMVLVVLSIAHAVASGAVSGLPVVLPAMFLTTRKAGGFGFSTIELGLCLSTSALFVLQYQVFLRWRARRLAQVSPVRAMQAGAVVLAFALMALSVIGSLRVLKPLAAASAPSYPHPQPQEAGHDYEQGAETKGMLADMDRVVVPGFILAIAAVSAQYLRQATACLLQVALDQQLQYDAASSHGANSPTSSSSRASATDRWSKNLSLVKLAPCAGLLAECIGPLAAAVIMGMAHRTQLPFPMDAAFIVPVSACCVFGIYILTFVLSLRFKTDFGDVETNLEYSTTATSSGQKEGKDE